MQQRNPCLSFRDQYFENLGFEPNFLTKLQKRKMLPYLTHWLGAYFGRKIFHARVPFRISKDTSFGQSPNSISSCVPHATSVWSDVKYVTNASYQTRLNISKIRPKVRIRNMFHITWWSLFFVLMYIRLIYIHLGFCGRNWEICMISRPGQSQGLLY